MTEQIGKVTLDYTFYNGQDQYSDGDIENDLLQLIMEEPDVEKILAEDDRWPVLYHFSPVRQNGSDSNNICFTLVVCNSMYQAYTI